MLANGFDTHAFFRPMELIGRDGIHANDVWRDGPRAYQTVALSGFPNFFMMLGPHSPVGNLTLTAVAESQADHILSWIDGWRRGEFDTVEPTASATERFNAKLRDELLNGEIFYSLAEAKTVIESWRQHYNRASEHPSGYVIEVKRFCCAGSDPAGYLGFCRARAVMDWAASVARALRAKTQGPSGRGWVASISPASAASLSVLVETLRIRLPSAASSSEQARTVCAPLATVGCAGPAGLSKTCCAPGNTVRLTSAPAAFNRSV